MDLRVLGPLEVVADDRVLALGGPKQRAVLAHLILQAERVVAADRLIDGLWGDEPPETARNTLQTYVYRLRKVLGEGRLESRDGGYVLNAGPDEVDAARFESMVREAKSLATSDPGTAAARLSDALALWRGPALGDLADEPSLRGEIARLEELRLSATERRIAAEIATGGHSTVVSELEALTAAYPLRERMWASLMLALFRSGRQAEALSTYQRAREVLADELGTEPSPELQGLHEQILRQDPALGSAERPQPAVRPSRMDLPPGTEFAGYRIESTLGRGGMSVVYLAEHAWLQRKVALKLLAPQLAEDERFRERFIRESRLAASLDHPNVIPIFEAGASGDDLYIAMRYVVGTDLRALLSAEGALEPARALAIVRQVAAALDAAHEQGLVHRDVKPGNVLISRPRGSDAEEHVYLSDFGLTKRAASDSGVTGTGQFVGTLDYAAPEQFKGGSADARTDVYSLGCVLYECLTGHPPFGAENNAGLMYAHLQEPPPAVTANRADLPKEIDAVVTKAMAKEPSARHQTAGALVDEAARALGLGRPSPSAEGGRSRLRRLIPAVAVVAALVVGIVVSSVTRGETPPADGDAATPSAGPIPSPTPEPTFRTLDRPLSGEEERLLTYIPEEVATDCLPLDRDEPIRGEIAALACRTDDVEVLYELFPTRDLMDEAFQINANVMRAPDGECATDTLAVTPYTLGGDPAGRVLCYTVDRLEVPALFGSGGTPDQSHIEWTDDNASIYAHAVRNDLGDLSLYDWWVTSSGPVLPTEGAVPSKDAPRLGAGARLADGSYLVVPVDGCAGFAGHTCALHIDGTSYGDTIIGAGSNDSNETGTLLRRKPNLLVFSPTSGWCAGLKDLGEGGDLRPATYAWSVEGDRVSFERTSGGRCAGPQKMDGGEPWTKAPPGVFALELGGSIELVDAGGRIVGTTSTPFTSPNDWPDWSPDGSRIAFSGAAPGGYDLYTMNPDGSELSPISEATGDDELTPAWSPDGTRIAFVAEGLTQPDWSSRLVVMSPDGTGRTEIVVRRNESILSPAWSPDGDRIAFTILSDVPGIYVVDADGGNLARIRDEPAAALSWTLDGERILFAVEGGIRSVLPDGTGERPFMRRLPEGIDRPVLDLHPDGRWMVMSNALGVTPSLVYLVRADGSDAYLIGSGSGSEPDWRPNAV